MDKMEIGSRPIKQIIPSKTNPRKYFDETGIKELAESIKEKGILIPLLVRFYNDQYIIIDGERRYRAAKLAGETDLPVDIRVMTDEEAIETQIIGFVQRKDITPLEEADTFQLLLEKEKDIKVIAQKTGRTASYITQSLIIRNMNQKWRKLFEDGFITKTQAISVGRLTQDQQKEFYESEHYSLGRGYGIPDIEDFKGSIDNLFHLDLDKAPFNLMRWLAGKCRFTTGEKYRGGIGISKDTSFFLIPTASIDSFKRDCVWFSNNVWYSSRLIGLRFTFLFYTLSFSLLIKLNQTQEPKTMKVQWESLIDLNKILGGTNWHLSS
jgi:ParB/RepB/Spo0J family partition protein